MERMVPQLDLLWIPRSSLPQTAGIVGRSPRTELLLVLGSLTVVHHLRRLELRFFEKSVKIEGASLKKQTLLGYSQPTQTLFWNQCQLGSYYSRLNIRGCKL